MSVNSAKLIGRNKIVTVVRRYQFYEKENAKLKASLLSIILNININTIIDTKIHMNTIFSSQKS